MQSQGMKFQQHILKMRKIQDALLKYIDSEYNEDRLFTKLIGLLEESKILKNHMELNEFLHLLSSISSNHPRGIGFFDKIFKILQKLKEDIKSSFNDFLIYSIFKENNRIILFLIEEKIVEVLNIINYLKIDSKKSYFYPEVKPFLSQKEIKYFSEPFDLLKRRRIGENDNSICKIIREDMIDDFISYVNEGYIELSSKIYESIYETNSFLMNKKLTLIEYATFFGAVRIFKYLQENQVQLDQSLWHYAIHSNNSEMIYILEDCQIEPDEKDYAILIEESIACHRSDTVNYIANSIFTQMKLEPLQMVSFGLKHRNYSYINKNFINESSFFDLCEYDYLYFATMLFKMKEIDINKKKIVI